MPNIPHKPIKFKNPKTNSEFTSEQIEKMIDSCLQVSRDLTEWEDNFISDLFEQFETLGDITEKQLQILEDIYAKKTR